ncbi:MAG: GNAT family N-acetyltransferase [Alphaproteobacteria bacterium]|nr:GNAT family N-acetyltransferase [Alphaproteobacteria bacterium]
MLFIREPSADLFKEAKQGLLEVLTNPSPFDISAAKKGAEFALQNFDGYIAYLEKNKSELQPQGRVPSTVLWLYDDEQFVGVFDVRHTLNEFLRQRGGHIAYEIIPSKRGQNYTLKGLKLVLNWCKQNLNLDEVLLFCDERNIASHKVLEKALAAFGGRRLSPHETDGNIECGYWLKTKK